MIKVEMKRIVAPLSFTPKKHVANEPFLLEDSSKLGVCSCGEVHLLQGRSEGGKSQIKIVLGRRLHRHEEIDRFAWHKRLNKYQLANKKDLYPSSWNPHPVCDQI